MSLIAGTRLGEFEILAPLGRGGMGEVYRARDSKLGREVAIKILPAELAQDPERLARFDREARVLASLNHPNIATLHGFFVATPVPGDRSGRPLESPPAGSPENERAGETGFLVMELVAGETLADRIARGPLPWREAVSVFEAIATGLKAAHESGIVHRDLKPANVKIDPEGRPKILDFGLARSVSERVESTAGLTHSPTLTAQATLPGVLLGTAPYMSPEQARGLPVDRRADVWAFGCCLYEALTGARAFDGEDISLILAAVLSREPHWQLLPVDVPPELATLLRRCLEKDARQRLQDLGDARWSFAEARSAPERRRQVDPTPPRTRGRALTAVLAVLALVSMAAAAWLAIARPDPRSSFESEVGGPPARFRVDPGLEGVGTQVAVHPSGTYFVFSASNGLYLYDLSDGEVRPMSQLPSGADRPFFSSDGEWLGYVETLEVSKAPATGGLSQHLTWMSYPAGASWRGDRIVLADWSGGLGWIPSAGGQFQRLSDDSALAHGVHPSFIEGRDAILFTRRDGGDAGRPSVFDLSSGTVRDLGVEGSAPLYLSSGHVLWQRLGPYEGDALRIWAAPFDLDRLQLSGDAVPVIGLASTNRVAPSFAASANGTLVTTDAARRDLVEVGHDGSRRRLPVATGELTDPRLSADGRSLAYTRGELGSEQLWLHELATGRERRISEASHRVSDAVWTPGGDVVYLDRSSARFALRLATPERGGEPLTLLESDELVLPYSVSPGGTLLFTEGVLGWRIKRLDLARPQHAEVWADKGVGVFNTVVFSPDGRWVAYARWSGGVGSRVYVRSFQGAGAERPVSVNEGWSPMWAADGRTIYFKNSTGLMGVAADASGGNLGLGSPRPIAGAITANVHDQSLDYIPLPDGKGFIVIAEAEPRGFTVITNLGRLLQNRAGAAGPRP